jgi:hypothetical protein
MDIYKKLKISIKQFDTVEIDNEIIRKCKLTILIDSDTLIRDIRISVNSFDYIKESFYFNIIKELEFVVKLAKKQIQNNKLYGVDTYWKWTNTDFVRIGDIRFETRNEFPKCVYMLNDNDTSERKINKEEAIELLKLFTEYFNVLKPQLNKQTQTDSKQIEMDI